MHDRARIHVRAGAGGDGCMSFRREAKVPRGGPDGGDGGRGGEVVLVCDTSLRDLHSFRRRSQYHAGRGGHGQGALKHGADGETLTIRVPPGTEARGAGDGDADDLQGRRWELLAHGQRATIARGGSGGRGNKRFATPTRQAPRFAERGLAGEEGWIELQLRLLADVGLVGMPNAGKSSLVSRLTRAAPKIASYPFTTLSPVLGVLEDEYERRQLIVADIPGLIEGASEGAGLGHDFLAHVERTRLLVHVLDIAPELSGAQDADPVSNHAAIEHELAAHDERLARLPRVLVLSKVDLVTPERAQAAVAEWQERLGPDVPVLATSSATRAGVRELGELLLRIVPDAGDTSHGASGIGAVDASAGAGDTVEEELAEHMVFRPGARDGGRGYVVQRLGPGSFAVDGRGVERLLSRYDTDNEDALAYVEERLRRIGVLDALQREGFVAGDEVRIAGMVFELDPDGAGLR
ncbi:MAG TPA: GTPase ObgE [Solirubrobacteraceae bacterium]|jgi:GTP-binding protein|nr:GTPase ObgE [Solirubrobacteraceae bacterium]